MTNETVKIYASGSKRAASSSPSRSKKAKRKNEHDSDQHSDSSSKNAKSKNVREKDEDYDSGMGKSKEIKSTKEIRLKKGEKKRGSRHSSKSSINEVSRSSLSGSSSSSEYEGESKPQEGSRYWGGDPDPSSDKEEMADDIGQEMVKGNRYWGGEPGKDNLEPGELSSHSQDVDYKIGSRYYDNKSDQDEENVSEDHKKDYVIGKRYYEDKSESSTKGAGDKDEKKVETNTSVPTRRAKLDDPLLSRTGGAYIPPAKLRMMQASITDKSSVSYQRIAWEALKKSIHGHINKVNTSNIGIIARLLMKENIVRGRGLLCRSLLQAQAASPTFTNVYACLVSVINSKFPNISELLMKRVILQFKRGFKRNDKALCIASCQFIAHLVNQQVAHEILALEMLTLLLESPTDDSVEVAIAFLKEVGQKLLELSPKGSNAIFDTLRNILHQGNLEKRVQYMIEVVFQVRKDGFRSFPSVDENLDLVEEEDRYTHILTLDEAVDPEDMLNVFKHDLEYELNEDKYKALKEEIIGGSSSEEESGEDSGEESDEEGSEDEDEEGEKKETNKVMIIDETETNLVALRRTIYLTIQSSLDFEECCHKLLKMDIKPGQEAELCHMLLDCCAELRTYEKFFGLLAQRFCQINRIYITPLEEMFAGSYATVHRLDTNKLRNVARFFGHLLFTDAISWQVLQTVRLNEEETTSSSRIFIKILFQELAEYMGLAVLNQRLKDPTLQPAMEGLFPRDNPKNTRFAINFFTSIGLGGLTDELREHLKTQPKPSAVAQLVDKLNISSDTSSSSSDSSESSSSDSDEATEKNKKKNKEKVNKKEDKQRRKGSKDVFRKRDIKRSEKDSVKHKVVRGYGGQSSSMEKEMNRKETYKTNWKEDERNERNGDKHTKTEKGKDNIRRDDRSRVREKDSHKKDYGESREVDREKRRNDPDDHWEQDNRKREQDKKVTTKDIETRKKDYDGSKEKQKKYRDNDRLRDNTKDKVKKYDDDSKEKQKKYHDDVNKEKPKKYDDDDRREKLKRYRDDDKEKPKKYEYNSKETKKDHDDNSKQKLKKSHDDDKEKLKRYDERTKENYKKEYNDIRDKDKENRKREHNEEKERQRRHDDKHRVEKERRNDRETEKYKSSRVYDERDRRDKDRGENRNRGMLLE